jgi:sugar/nucleoside kinase (ribokinase family)
MSRILCIGDAMVDVIVQLKEPVNTGSDTASEITMLSGGAAANTAAWLAATDNEVYFAGRVGDDAAGDGFIAELDRFGVSHGAMKVSGERTGMVVVLVDQNGERTMFPDSGANSGISKRDLPSLATFDAVFLSGYSLYNVNSTANVREMIQDFKSAKLPIIFDPVSVGAMANFGGDKVLAELANFDCLILNRDEALFLSAQKEPNSALSKLKNFLPTVVIKTGAEGAIGIDKSNDPISQSSSAENVLDTTGAGDAFAAGFIPEWLKNRDLKSAMKAGNLLAGQCVALLGARPRLNT